MVFFNYATMQMAAKIVYYGPGLCGKTTNLHHIYQKTSPQSRGEMVSLETETDRTLFFDLLPIDVGVIGGFKTRLQLYTVPGQVFYNTTRKLVLKGVDGIVFVADSQKPMLEANVESLKNLRENLAEIGLNLDELPLVVQLNKRDLPNVLDPATIMAAIDPEKRFEAVEAVASGGVGVFETLKLISKLTLRTLRRRMTGDEPPRAAPRLSAAAAQFKIKDDAAAAAAAASRATVAGNTPLPSPPAIGTTSPVATPAFGASAAAATVAQPAPQPVAVQVIEPVPEPVAQPEPLLLPEDVFPEATSIAPSSPQDQSNDQPFDDLPLEAPPEPPKPAPVAAAPAPQPVRQPEPEIEIPRSEKREATPEVKKVKVRSLDVMAELESLRKRATQGSTPAPASPKREVPLPDLDDLISPSRKRDLQKTLHLEVPANLLGRAKSLRVTVSFEDGDAAVLRSEDQSVELGDLSDVLNLSVNLKIDPV